MSGVLLRRSQNLCDGRMALTLCSIKVCLRKHEGQFEQTTLPVLPLVLSSFIPAIFLICTDLSQICLTLTHLQLSFAS